MNNNKIIYFIFIRISRYHIFCITDRFAKFVSIVMHFHVSLYLYTQDAEVGSGSRRGRGLHILSRRKRSEWKFGTRLVPLARVRLSSKRSPRGDISGMRIERTRNSHERVREPPSIWRYLRNYVTRAYRPIYSPFFLSFFFSSGRTFSTVSLIRCFVTVLVFFISRCE